MEISINIIGQVPKDDLAPDTIEDAFDFNEKKGIVIVSDGASESYDSKTLSKLICRNFIEKQIINHNWFNKLLSDFTEGIDVSSLSWSREAAFKRGSFASLLAIKHGHNKEIISLIAIGDSIAFLIDEERIINSFPYKTSSQFSLRPELISTVVNHNNFVNKSGLKKKYENRWDLEKLKDPIILCMTDSLGEWMLRNYEKKDPKWLGILNLNNSTDLSIFVKRQWELKDMRKDDITLIKIKKNN